MAILSSSECLLLLVVSGICVFCFQRLSLPYKILSWSVIVAFILSVLSKIFNKKYGGNAPILQIQSITQYIFYSIIYYYLFKNKLIKKSILVSIIIITICFLLNAIYLQPFKSKFPTYIDIPTQALFALFSLLLFKEMLMYPLKINIIKQSIFWYNTAILFYATTMFFNLGLSNYLAVNNVNDSFIFYFWYAIVYTFNLLITLTILTERKNNILTDAG